MTHRRDGHTTGVEDPYALSRFVEAQDSGRTYDTAVRELRRGHKDSHWMWFVLPQLAGLGHSATAQHYALRDADEARAYLAHPVLGPRLRECAEVLLSLPTRDPVAVLGGTDARKLRSCMTLFAAVAPDEPVFHAVLEQYFDGARDRVTTQLLEAP